MPEALNIYPIETVPMRLTKNENLLNKPDREKSVITLSDLGFHTVDALCNLVLEYLESSGYSQIQNKLNDFYKQGRNLIIDKIKEKTCYLHPNCISKINWQSWLNEIVDEIKKDEKYKDKFNF